MGLRIFLDDNRQTTPGWDRAYTAEDVKLHLIHNDVDDLSIDHDLDLPKCPKCQFNCGHRGHHGQPGPVLTPGCKHKCDCHSAGDETGLDLTKWMVGTGRWPKNKPTCHSHNLDNSLRIKKLIEDNYPAKR
jgi:hypothetical protein